MSRGLAQDNNMAMHNNTYRITDLMLGRIAESTLAVNVAQYLYENRKIGIRKRNHVIEMAIKNLDTIPLNESARSKAHKYTPKQLNESVAIRCSRMLNENANQEGFFSDAGKKIKGWFGWKDGDTLGRNVARAAGFNPDEKWYSGNNLLNGAIWALNFVPGVGTAAGAGLRAAGGLGKGLLTAAGRKAFGSAAAGALRKVGGGSLRKYAAHALKTGAKKNAMWYGVGAPLLNGTIQGAVKLANGGNQNQNQDGQAMPPVEEWPQQQVPPGLRFPYSPQGLQQGLQSQNSLQYNPNMYQGFYDSYQQQYDPNMYQAFYDSYPQQYDPLMYQGFYDSYPQQYDPYMYQGFYDSYPQQYDPYMQYGYGYGLY